MACAKHFAGDGGTTMGIDRGNTEVSWDTLVNTHMAAYSDAIAKGVSTIMVSYSSWNSKKMHSNKKLITDELKGRMGFDGVVISDFEGLDRMTEPWGVNYTNSVLLGVNAGIDVVMVPYDFRDFMAIVKYHVNTGAIAVSRIDDAVTRILRLKFRAGLFEYPYSDSSLKSFLGSLVSPFPSPTPKLDPTII